MEGKVEYERDSKDKVLVRVLPSVLVTLLAHYSDGGKNISAKRRRWANFCAFRMQCRFL